MNHITRVMWNEVQSKWIDMVNGVKQGGVLSPVLFCVYIDGLLSAVSTSRMAVRLVLCLLVYWLMLMTWRY